MKTYRGLRINGDATVIVEEDGQEPRPLRHHVRHSPDGFEWGYGGSGPADTARCILLDAMQAEPSAGCYNDFKWQVIAHFPKEGFTLTGDEIHKWHREWLAFRASMNPD